MIKVDIVNEVSKIADITKVKAEVAVDAVFDAMRVSMQRGDRIELRGFGVFQVKPRKRGIGRNPRTGKEVRIPPGRTIRFKPGKDLQKSDNRPHGLILRPTFPTSILGVASALREPPVFLPPTPSYRCSREPMWRHVGPVRPDRGDDHARPAAYRYAASISPSAQLVPPSRSGADAARALVQRVDPRDPGLLTSWGTTMRAATTGRCVASLLPADAVPADRHARRVHPDSRADSRQASALRHRHRGTDCRIRRRASRC